MKQHLVQQQTIQRKLNQSLIQSIQLLQFTSIELYEYIEEIVKENPLIEEVVYDSDMQSHSFRSSETVSMEGMNAAEKTLYDRLKEQLFTIHIPEDLLPIVEFGIYSLNENGYLEITLEEWAENCSTPLTVVEEALQVIQQLEPNGVGARNLGECIHLQLRHMEDYQSYMEDLLHNHLDWIADFNYDAIKKEYHIESDEITELMKMIQACNPKPGKLLDTSEVEYIVPEAKIYKEDDTWKISFYNWSVPKLVINPLYENIEDKQAVEFLKRKREQLNWLEGAIKYRTATIELVIRKVVEKQLQFFEQGLLHLEPMTLKDVADELDLHPSTISRTISNKYVETPHGVFAIKFFFQTGIKQNGEKIAAIVIKHMIKNVIDGEDKNHPLSDEKIKEILSEQYSLEIARRTVMKYRQELNIPASYKRKE